MKDRLNRWRETVGATARRRARAGSTGPGGLVLVTDLRLDRPMEGLVPPVPIATFDRYRRPGHHLTLVARRSAREPQDGARLPAELRLCPTPDFDDVSSLLCALPRLVRLGARLPSQQVLLRLPSVAGLVVAAVLVLRGKSYGVEVAGDLGAVLASGAVGRWSRPLAALGLWAQRRAVRGAHAVVYVTPRSLQQRYPPRPGALSSSVSDVQLSPSDFRQPRPARPVGPWTLVAVGSQERAYKGHDVLLEAVAYVRELGLDVRLDLVGDGKLNAQLRAHAGALDLQDVVTFHGHLPSREALRSVLDDADLFVMPSLTEGLPRALLEAMGRGLPVVVSDVGGMPDLVSPEFCVPPGDAAALGLAIADLLRDPSRATSAGGRHHGLALSFTEESQRVAMQRWLDGWVAW